MESTTFIELEKILGEGRVRKEVILAPYTTFKMGGPAQFYFEAVSDDDLVKAIALCRKLNLRLTVLGGASNVIIDDSGIKGLVVRNRNIYKKIIKEDDAQVNLRVSSGYSMTRLAKESAEEGLSGFEYHFGLPGTLGGALYMNSKWTKPESYVGDDLYEAFIVDLSGNTKTVNRDYFDFGYDRSILQKTKEIVISATFKLKKENREILLKRIMEVNEYRKKTQPFGISSSGCFFRNVSGVSAGSIIDKLGLKGFSVGNLEISDKHANFVINRGGATSADFKQIIATIKTQAREKLGITLQEEVVFIS